MGNELSICCIIHTVTTLQNPGRVQLSEFATQYDKLLTFQLNLLQPGMQPRPRLRQRLPLCQQHRLHCLIQAAVLARLNQALLLQLLHGL